MKLHDITGQRFTKLVAFRHVPQAVKTTWMCRCDCGKEIAVRAANLKSGNSKSCGCLVPDIARGWNKTPEYTAFKNAKNRCERKQDTKYAYYGGRGIKFLFRDMDQFIASIGPRPSDAHSIDRIDPNGNYEPGNVRWATKTTQARNKQTSRIVKIDGIERPLKDWCEHFGQPYKRVWERIKEGWSVEQALTQPAGPTAARKPLVEAI